MKILLVGEYSNFHNSLKEGLHELGHQVVICSDNDFKNYPMDISVYAHHFKDNFFLNACRQIIYRITKLDLAQIENAWHFFRARKQLMGFDIVQLVNEQPIQSTPYLEKKIITFLEKHNTKLFLVSCGDDYPCISFMKNGGFRYSILTPCLEDPTRSHCEYTMRFLRPEYKKLHEHVYQKSRGVIAGDLDYAIPLQGHPHCLGFIPYPINFQKLVAEPKPIIGKIRIFHGINRVNYYKKGNYIFEEALEIIQQKYADKVEIITTISRPYQEYIKNFDNAHIILDQIYAYDQGYNALEAMAKGKVVFTGAEKEFYEHYRLNERVAINALPDAQAIVKELAYLIENPHQITLIGKNAQLFIQNHHQHTDIAKKYIEIWSKN